MTSIAAPDALSGNPRPPFLAGLLLGNVLVIALLGVLVFLSLSASRESVRRRATTATENLAASLQQSVGAELAQADKAVHTVVLARQREERLPGVVQAVLQEQSTLAPALDALLVTDASGTVRQGAGRLATHWTDLRELGFFQQARNAPDSRLLISEPLRDRHGGGWHLALARRLSKPDGSFDGVVCAWLPTEHFQRLFAGVDLGAQGAVSLRSSSLQLIARHTASQDQPTDVGSVKVSKELAEALRSGLGQGGFLARTALDQTERINAYHRVEGYPLTVVAGLGTEEYLAPWRAQAWQMGGLAALVALLVLGASGLVYRSWRREALGARALLAEGRRNHALLLTASDGVHVLDRSGVVVEMSLSFATMLGYEREQLLGRHVSTWDAKLPPEQIASWLRSFSVGQTYKFETQHRRADGSLVDVEVTSASVLIDQRQLIYCAARDITRRKQLEAQLAATTAEIEDLYDKAPCGYHSLDKRGVFVHINATELQWLGWQRDEVVGKKHITEFFTPEGQALFQEQFPKLKREGHIEGLQFDLMARDGTLRSVSISVTAVTDENGEFLRTRSVMYDVTELQRTKDQLRQLAREQQAMLDNDLIGIVKLKDRCSVWKNQAMDRIFGYGPGELLGRSSRILYPDEESFEAFGQAAYAALSAGGRYRAQLKMLRKDGTPLWIDANGVLLSATNQESLWMLADITPIKQTHEKVEHIAFHDILTGLPNRLLLADRLQQALASAERQRRTVAVCYLDLDGFKQVNDEFGHAAGDELLVTLAERLQHCVRNNDTVSRLGGDEFALLLSNLEHVEEAGAILARVHQEMGRAVRLEGGREVNVSASIGVAYYPQDGVRADVLLAHADRAMYRAKRQGRSRICRYEAPIDAMPGLGVLGA